MKRKFRAVASAMLALSMMISAFGAAMAQGGTSTVILSSEGLNASDQTGRDAVYTGGAYLSSNWNAGGAALGDPASVSPGNVAMKLARVSLASSTPLLAATAWDEGVTHIGADRYVLLPLLKTSTGPGTAPSSSNTSKFSDKFSNTTGSF